MNEAPETLFHIEMEQQLLGALLTNNDLYGKVSSFLKSEMFFEPTHADIYRHICDLIDHNKLASPVTLKPLVENHPNLPDLGGVQYLARMAGASISSSAIADYAQGIEALYRRRVILETLEHAADTVRTEADPDRATDVLENALLAMPDREGKESSVSFLKSAVDTLRTLQRAINGEEVAVSTGLTDLDRRLSGFSKQDLVILAGRPSMGKTAVALSFALAAASGGRGEAKKVAIVSREMSDQQLTQRLLSDRSKIEYAKMRRGDLTQEEFVKVAHAVKDMETLPIRIIPDHIVDIYAVQTAVKGAMKDLGGLDLVIVDYLQLLSAPGARSTNEEVSKVSAGLKNMAKALDVPVIALSQLSRACEMRDDKRPRLSDLRDSGSIEQDADVVMFCYRHEYYMSRETPPRDASGRADWESDFAACKNKMEIITAKQRMGSTGIDVVGCHMPTNRFWDLGFDDERQGGMGF